MKKFFVTLVISFLFGFAHAQSMLFNKYENVDGVSTVIVSKAMLRMIPDLHIGEHNIRKIASKLDRLKVLTCERQSLIDKIAKDAAKIYNKHPWEEMMRYKEGRSLTVIYMNPLGKGKYQYVLYTMDKGELQIIDITGAITLEEIKDITGND